jgi:NAD+ kinase
MPRRVLLLINRAKPEVVDALPEVRALIAKGGGVVALEQDTRVDQTPPPAEGAELVVVLGGDGTLITQAARCMPLGLPMLGVNLGKVGFLAEFDLDALRAQARALFNGSEPLQLGERALIEARVERPGAPGGRAILALNDCVVTAGPPYRMVAIGLSIDGQPGPTIQGDGVIVCTPLGSTAYNASAGGPIIAPEVRALAVTPIAAHSLAFRPVVVAGSSTITLSMERVNDAEGVDGDAGTTLVVDGQLQGRLRRGDRLVLRLHERPVRLVRNPRGNYWSTLVQKLRWAAPPAARHG